jgi:hypothetical protein
MGNTIASGGGNSLEVGKNCEKLTQYTSDIVLTLLDSPLLDSQIYKIAYNNSKFGKACLAGTQTPSGEVHAENKYFNFQWNLIDIDGELFIFGNHTKDSEDNNSVALFEVMQVDPEVLKANKSKFSAISKKIDKKSKLAAQIKKLIK